MTTTSTITTITTGFIWRLHLDVSHVDLSIKEENWSPSTFGSPIIHISSFLDVHDSHFSSVILNPFLPSFVHNCHEITLAVMIMLYTRPMVMISLMENESD